MLCIYNIIQRTVCPHYVTKGFPRLQSDSQDYKVTHKHLLCYPYSFLSALTDFLECFETANRSFNMN